MGSIKVIDGADAVIEMELVRQFPDLTLVPVGETLDRVSSILASLANAITLAGGLAVISGMFVLAGALGAGRGQRELDAVVMKVLGSTRRNVITSFLAESRRLLKFDCAASPG
ncbi:MAG: hypothetical protein Q8L54_08000 [Devosia sp.]|nr:hypothetical protein [Devosia sp.]